jgi:hypothetical protein
VAAEGPSAAKASAEPSALPGFDPTVEATAETTVMAAETAAYACRDGGLRPHELGPQRKGGEQEDHDDRDEQRNSLRHS